MERMNCSSTTTTPWCYPVTDIGISRVYVNCVDAHDSDWFVGFLVLDYPAMSFVDRIFDESERVFSFVGTWNEGPALYFSVLTSLGDPLCISEQWFSNLKHEISISGT
jgi:hypothetical protein